MRKFLIVLALILVGAGFATAQTVVPDTSAAEQQTLEQYLKMVRGDLQAQRDSAIQGVLELNEAERKAFLPLRQSYDKEAAEIAKRRLAAIQDYMKVHDKLTPESARELSERFFKLEEDRLALRKKYFDLMSKQVSPVIAVQFLQLERQFETMGDLKLATRMPLAVK